MPSRPTIVSAATSAFRIASSVASIAPQNKGVIEASGTMSTASGWCGAGVFELVIRPAFAVEKAKKMSPLELPPAPPTRATPRPARCARRSS